MARRLLFPRSVAAVLALCGVALVGGFALGRLAPPLREDPTPAALAASLRAALGEGDALERLRRSTDLLQHLNPDNLVEVAAVYDRMRPVIEDWEVRPFIAAWARFDPAAAFQHALGWPARGRQEVGAEAALEGWATFDPIRAKNAFEDATAEHAGLRKPLLRGLVTGWARSGPALEGLAGYILVAGERNQNEAIGAAVRELMRSGGPDATLAWVDPILRDDTDRGRLKRTLFRISLRAVARWDPERAAAFAARHVGSEWAEGGPLVVAGQWGGRDGAATLAWLRQLPAGEPRDKGVHRAFEQWLRSDPLAARQWLDSESLEAFHDPALEARAQELAKEEAPSGAPEGAFGWCERILDAERQRRCFQAVATRWYLEDAEAAEAWLQQSSLDEKTRRAVRRPGRQRGSGPREHGPRAR